MRGATADGPWWLATPWNFNPRPPCGGRRSIFAGPRSCLRFQSTPPMRGATWPPVCGRTANRISIHAPHAGGDNFFQPFFRAFRISIHAPHAGGDRRNAGQNRRRRISIHAPHAGGDNDRGQPPCSGRISIHAPHAGGDVVAGRLPRCVLISIHAPHAGGDPDQRYRL